MLDLSIDALPGRYDRQERITWWNQDRLRRASVLVVGAGALVNEVLKNLALLGVGQIHVIDCDTVERSNLARCVLFRDADNGLPKAEVAARATKALNGDVDVVASVGNVMHLGLGSLVPYDLVICGLDSREARLWVNQACRKLAKTWIDGAIEGLRGLVRVFPPFGACYECTLGEADRRILANRRSCSLLTPEEMEAGKVPTTATTASVVAGVEVQEAIKILCGREDLVALNNRALVITGETLETYIVSYTEDESCLAHDTYDSLGVCVYDDNETLADLVLRAEGGTERRHAVAELEDDIVRSAVCNECGYVDAKPRRVALLGAGDALCPECRLPLRFELGRAFTLAEAASLVLSEDVLPNQGVVTVRSDASRHHYVASRGTV